MKGTGRALTESFFLHGLLVGAIIFMAARVPPPPKIIRLDFSLQEQTAALAPKSEQVAAQPPMVRHPPAPIKPSPRVAVNHHPPVPQTRPKATVRALPKKPSPVPVKPPAEVAAVEPNSSPAPQADATKNTGTSMPQTSSGSATLPKTSTAGTTTNTGEEYRHANFAAIRDSILANLHYPMIARRQGWCGKVDVAFLIKPDGHIGELRIEKSSGYAVLDEQALEAIRRSAPFTPPRIAALLVMPVTFQLN